MVSGRSYPLLCSKYADSRALTELLGETEGDDVGSLLGLIEGGDVPVMPIGEVYCFEGKIIEKIRVTRRKTRFRKHNKRRCLPLAVAVESILFSGQQDTNTVSKVQLFMNQVHSKLTVGDIYWMDEKNMQRRMTWIIVRKEAPGDKKMRLFF